MVLVACHVNCVQLNIFDAVVFLKFFFFDAHIDLKNIFLLYVVILFTRKEQEMAALANLLSQERNSRYTFFSSHIFNFKFVLLMIWYKTLKTFL